jgi:two-component system, sensor histidine kinase and response regulator
MTTVQSLPSLSLLIVEDDKMARDLIVRMVAMKFPDCSIYTAENGVNGLKLFKEHNPDIVITDVSMPVMDGIEMAREIRSINSNATYIVLTAFNDKDILAKLTDIGVCAFLPKPIVFKELFAAIEKCTAVMRIK